MTELEKLHKKLEELYDQVVPETEEGEEATDKFLETVEEIVKFHDPSSLPVLLNYYVDEVEREEEKFSYDDCAIEALRHAVLELLGYEDLVKGILTNFHLIFPRSGHSAAAICCPILGTPETLEYFKENMHLARKETLLEFLEWIDEDERADVASKVARKEKDIARGADGTEIGAPSEGWEAWYEARSAVYRLLREMLEKN